MPVYDDIIEVVTDKPMIQNLGNPMNEPVTESKKPKKIKPPPIDWDLFDNVGVIVSKIIKKKPKMKKFKEGIERINEIIEEEQDLNFVI
jgi:hypothetical protein